MASRQRISRSDRRIYHFENSEGRFSFSARAKIFFDDGESFQRRDFSPRGACSLLSIKAELNSLEPRKNKNGEKNPRRADGGGEKKGGEASWRQGPD
jgi:hypothetical protein